MKRRVWFAVGAVVLVLGLGRFACSHGGCGSESAGGADNAGGADALGKDPRLVLGRVWLDKLPRSSRDDRELWIFLGGGIGIHEKGSWFRSSMDIFDFERQGNALSLTFLHDKSKAQTKFTIESCDDKPPFNLCLELADPPRGPKKLYGFGDDDDMDRAMPWARDEVKVAEAKARSAHLGE